MPRGPVAGDVVEDFELPDQAGTPRRLTELAAGGPVVLFFYPAAMSYGCTREGCRFRDLQGELAAAGARPVGISADSVERQRRFADAQGFDFPLLSDADRRVGERFGVARRPAALGYRRHTFVIGSDRTVVAVVRGELAFRTHADRALEALRRRAG